MNIGAFVRKPVLIKPGHKHELPDSFLGHGLLQRLKNAECWFGPTAITIQVFSINDKNVFLVWYRLYLLGRSLRNRGGGALFKG